MSEPKINRLFWDIETSPNIGFFWQAGYKKAIPYESIIQERAIICICYKWESEKKVHSLTWDKGCDKKLIEEFNKVLLLADETVAHNGDNFDIKFLYSRLLYHNFVPTYHFNPIDTLKIARQKFRFNSNRLDYLGQYLFGQGKISTSFSLWKDIVLGNCDKAMNKMVRYCKRDVVLLQKVYNKLSDFTEHKTHVGVLNGLDAWTCPKCGSASVHRIGSRVTKMGRKYRMRCNDCGSHHSISLANLNKYIEYKKYEKP